jgi:hypothetical protein
MHTYSYKHTYANPTYLYKHIRRTKPTDLEIHKVTTGASLSTGTSPTTETIKPINLGINSEKYEHPYQIENLNPDRQVPP